MHLCYEIRTHEIISLILLPLLPHLATAIVIVLIVVIVHLVIITSPALPFRARWNPATPSPQSQRQIESFGGGWWRHDIETPLSKATLRQLLIVVCLSSIVSDGILTLPPLPELPHHDEGVAGGRHCDAPPLCDRRPCPRSLRATAAPAPTPESAAAVAAARLLLLLSPVLFLLCCTAAV
jgi:hypothetical protein